MGLVYCRDFATKKLYLKFLYKILIKSDTNMHRVYTSYKLSGHEYSRRILVWSHCAGSMS